MVTFLTELRFALRRLRRAPGFALVVMLTLGLGIGANTAIFSVVNAVLLRPLPYREPARLVQVEGTATNLAGWSFSISYPHVQVLREARDLFAGVGAYRERKFNSTGFGDPRELDVTLATPDLLHMLGVHPVLGRGFTRGEERRPVALLSHWLWVSGFGADSSVLGRVVTLDGNPYSVIGVMPADLGFPSPGTALWLPLGAVTEASDGRHSDEYPGSYQTLARLQPGVGPARLAAGLGVLSRRAEPADSTYQFKATPLIDHVVGQSRSILWLLLGAVTLVLLVACTNAASLQLARARGARRGLLIRRALGAGRLRLALQVLAESVLLGLGGAGVALVSAYWALDLVRLAWPAALPRLGEARIDGTVLGFTLALSLVTGLVFGLAPALQAARPGMEARLREESDRSSRHRGQRLLVVVQLALTLVLVTGAGLLVRSLSRLVNLDSGLDVVHLLAARIRPTPSRYPTDAARLAYYEELREQIASRPGVSGVTIAQSLPFSSRFNMFTMDPRQIRPDDPDKQLMVGFMPVGPDFFRTTGMRLLAGHAFPPDDPAGSPLGVVINQRMARRFWPGQDAVGQRLPPGYPDAPGRAATVVGVVEDSRYVSLEREPDPSVYMALARSPGGDSEAWLLVRAVGNPLALAPLVRDLVRRSDPSQPVADLLTLGQSVERSTASRRLTLTLVGAFAGLALLLAVIGVYGVSSYLMQQRTRELGIRLALGARPGDLGRLVLWQGTTLALAGAGAGLVLAVAGTRLIHSLLFEVSPTDPVTYGVAATLLVVVAAGATWLPARRAARVDPLITLRAE